MKTLLITVAIISSSLFNSNYAKGTINMNKELERVVKFKNGTLPLEQNKSEFVKVSFRINKAGEVQILNMNYSDEIIKNELVEKLSEVRIEEKHNSEEIYNYNFTFKKY